MADDDAGALYGQDYNRAASNLNPFLANRAGHFSPAQLERLVLAAEQIAKAFELISNKYR